MPQCPKCIESRQGVYCSTCRAKLAPDDSLETLLAHLLAERKVLIAGIDRLTKLQSTSSDPVFELDDKQKKLLARKTAEATRYYVWQRELRAMMERDEESSDGEEDEPEDDGDADLSHQALAMPKRTR